MDLRHVHRRHAEPYSHAYGTLASGICTHLETCVWAPEEAPAEFRIGCDDPIRVYVNDALVLRDEGRQHSDPFALLRVDGRLAKGLNRIVVVVGNRASTTWSWNGFSLVLRTAVQDRFRDLL